MNIFTDYTGFQFGHRKRRKYHSSRISAYTCHIDQFTKSFPFFGTIKTVKQISILTYYLMDKKSTFLQVLKLGKGVQADLQIKAYTCLVQHCKSGCQLFDFPLDIFDHKAKI